MDVLGDALLAMEEFRLRGIGPTDGEKYLRLYGLFNAVYIHQDSIRSMYLALLGERHFVATGSGWKRIRVLRNQLTGHPNDSRGKRFAYITRITLSENNVDATVVDHTKPGGTAEGFSPIAVTKDYAHDAADMLEALLAKTRARFAFLFTVESPEELSDYDSEPPRRVEYVFKVVGADGEVRRLH
jgi:hypothetical protein